MKSVLMDLSGVFSDEGWDAVIASGKNNAILRLRALEGTRGYCDPKAEKFLCEAIADFPVRAVHWIDTGNYHYLSALWLRKLHEPAALFLFDHHPDDRPPAFGNLLSCGSWVIEARANPMVREDAKSAYLSIDLDFLSPEYARTDWDQGTASLPRLLESIDLILDERRLAGVDICGGRRIRDGATAEDLAVNRRTRSVLLQYFSDK